MIKRILENTELSDLSVLRQVSIPIDDLNEAALIAVDLKDTLEATNNGIGLAAPQIGVNKRIILINYKDYANVVMINPKIVESSGRMKSEEGCLSVPKTFKRVKRKQSVVVEYTDLKGKKLFFNGSGMEAVLVQHEIDHLDGKLFTDETL